MVTEPAADSELSVALPPSLSEWLDERAAALGIEREALLVQLLETHRSTAEMDDDGLVSLFESVDAAEPSSGSTIDDLDERVTDIDDRTDDVDRRVGDVDGRVDDVDSRVDDVEAKLATNVEDIRQRVLQLRDAVEEGAPADHSLEEISALSDRLDALSAETDERSQRTDELAEDLRRLSAEMGSTDDRIETLESKIDRLARAVLEDRRRGTATAELDEIRRAANRTRTTEADCADCGTPVRIGLLSEAACPHCDRRLRGLETPESVFRWFKTPTLTVEDTPDNGGAEDPDE